MLLFDRRLKVIIEIGKQTKSYEHSSSQTSLKIDFNIQKQIDKQESAQISITGLNLKDIQNLSTKFDYKTKKVIENKIILQAGYANQLNTIFNGNIVEAKPNLSADFVLNLQAVAGFYKTTIKREPVSIVDATLFDVFKNIANDLDVALDFSIANKKIGNYSYVGSAAVELKKIAKYYNVFAWLENGMLFVADSKTSKTGVTLINSETGLVGNPQPMANGCSIVTLLQPNITLNSIVKCEFKKFYMLNGNYKVIAINHKGSNYGNEFVSNLDLENL